MELRNRRLLLFDDDVPESTASPQGPVFFHEPTLTTNSSTQISAFDSNTAYTFLVLLTALLFLGFFSIYIRRFAEDSSLAMSSRRRRRHHHHDGFRPFSSLSKFYRSRSAASYGGLDPTTIHSLPVFSHREDAKYRIDCAICLTEFQVAESVKMIPYCKHEFHPECIDKWLFSHVTCPVCRSTQFLEVKCDGGLGVVEQMVDQGVSDTDPDVGLTVEISSTCLLVTEVRTTSLRRSSSYTSIPSSSNRSSLKDQRMLQRTASF